MKFNHLIEINDPLNPLSAPLTRNQIWNGLVLRAEAPQLFMPHLDGCTIVARSNDTLSRELAFGELVICDRVLLTAQMQVEYQVPAQENITASTLQMTIEEPQPDVFFVRFAYDGGAAQTEESMDAFYNEFRRSAYHEADIDTIRIIREMAEQGTL
jgi:hypothetical protein